jgi:hypothetical protein
MIMIENYFINLNPIFKYTILLITLYESFRKTSSIGWQLACIRFESKDVNGYNTHGFYLPKPVSNRTN